jgi:hypothetical protein
MRGAAAARVVAALPDSGRVIDFAPSTTKRRRRDL